jgi:hypothetical protein
MIQKMEEAKLNIGVEEETFDEDERTDNQMHDFVVGARP